MSHVSYFNGCMYEYLRMAVHLINGSPVNPSLQLQIGWWLTMWQIALCPHVPGQGSIHFWLLQALFNKQSELKRHSGRQFGGWPKKPVMQEHTAWLLKLRQLLFDPHGDGLQGFLSSIDSKNDNNNYFKNKYWHMMLN